MGLSEGYGSSGREPSWQAQGPVFKPQYCIKKKKKEDDIIFVEMMAESFPKLIKTIKSADSKYVRNAKRDKYKGNHTSHNYNCRYQRQILKEKRCNTFKK
jgi:hypothetical protein